MNVLIFAGPSISNCLKIKEEFNEFTFLPPLKHADLISSVEFYKPDIIGIIDDYSGKFESVWHNEIIYILDKGIKVFGACGTGAVRAVELERFGMSGVGEVYDFFKNNLISSDDEVICLFDEKDNYTRLTEPFINIRFTIKRMDLQEELSKKILTVLKDIHWKERTRNAIFKKLKQNNIYDGFLNEFEHAFVDIQARDACKLLATISRYIKKNNSDSKFEEPDISDGNLFGIMYERDRKVRNHAGSTTLNDIASYAALNHPESEELIFNGLNREIVAFLAGYLGVEVKEDDIVKEVRRFRRKSGITNTNDFKEWLKQNDINEKKLYHLMEKHARCRRMQRWFKSRRKYRRLTSLINEQLILNNEYEKYKEKTIDMEKQISKEDIREKFNSSSLKEIVAKRMKRDDFPWNTHPFEGADESGFSGQQLHLSLLREEISFEKITQTISKLFDL